MSDDESDFDSMAHAKLLESIANIGKHVKKKRVHFSESNRKVHANELVDLIRSTRNVDEIKQKLQKKKNEKSRKSIEPRTLAPPVHRQARERIESTIAYMGVQENLEEWAPIVNKHRLADQIIFPIEKVPVQSSVTERVAAFKPRTPLEIDMAAMLKTSKNNLSNDKEYTEAELELLKAMNVKEARERIAHLRKMRALVGYRETKLKRQAKIKSKSYHRHLKRQKRKKLIKEFEELVIKNPEAAQEKLEEIERQRILERATLKHRNGGKRIQQLARYASKNPEYKKVIEEQIKLGRELVEKHGRESDSEADDCDNSDQKLKAMSISEMLENAAQLAAKDGLETGTTNPALKSRLHEMRNHGRLSLMESSAEAVRFLNKRQKTSSLVSDAKNEATAGTACDAASSTLAEEWGSKGAVWEGYLADDSGETVAEGGESSVIKKTRKLKKKKGKKEKIDLLPDAMNIDEMFERVEQKLTEGALQEGMRLKSEEMNASEDADTIKSKTKLKRNTKLQNGKKKSEECSKRMEHVADISLDPRHFLQVETTAMAQISGDFIDEVMENADEQRTIMAEAFEDVDIVGDFEAEKEAVVDSEKLKDVDLGLEGWGSWTGPGITNKKKERFVVKAKKKKRRDQGLNGLIISEGIDKSIEKIQLRSVPFPYTTVEDYETVVRQPIGKEWNTQKMYRKLIQPRIVTKAGKIIKSLDRDVLESEKMNDHSDK